MFVVYVHNDNFGGLALEGGLKGRTVSVADLATLSDFFLNWKRVGNTGLRFRLDHF